MNEKYVHHGSHNRVCQPILNILNKRMITWSTHLERLILKLIFIWLNYFWRYYKWQTKFLRLSPCYFITFSVFNRWKLVYGNVWYYEVGKPVFSLVFYLFHYNCINYYGKSVHTYNIISIWRKFYKFRKCFNPILRKRKLV